MAVELKIVKTRRELRQFVDFPEQLYRGCENWVPALRGDEFDTFDKKKNGAYDYCESECYLALKDGRVAGRVAAIINHNANRDWKEHNVRFGWLDFIEDREVLKALLDAVEAWGKARGCTRMKGPWGFTDMDKEGLLVEGYEHLSPFTCLYNYPYYDKLLQELGFLKDVDWTQRVAKVTNQLPPMFQFADMIEQRFGLHVARARSTRELSEKYGLAIFHMYNETFAPLFQFTPLTDKQIERYLQTYVPILRPEFVSVCLDKDERPVGFTFCVPSLSKAVRRADGRLFPFGFVHILRALRHNDTLEALMIGVLPEYQGKGANVLMFKQIHENALKFGINRLILNPQLEENFKVQSLFEQYEMEPFMRRRAYCKDI
ncbi:MAG: GNAT family N-acetyltransferase [Bacteroidales bacterium]|nr:GNAT family N-acetyltransferase [Bacteroidales bacterium]